MTGLPTAADVARTLADTLEARGLSYAVGGVLALGYYAVPLADVEAVMRVQADLDRAFVRKTLVDLAGPDDERIHALDEIERDVQTQMPRH